MMKNVEIIDNYLSDDEFELLVNDTIKNPTFPWFLCDRILEPEHWKIADEKYNWQMVHQFYHTPADISPAMPVLNDLLVKLNPRFIVKIKLNMNPISDKIIEHGLHTDILKDDMGSHITTSVFYLNNNNGYTMLEDGTKIESKENRLVSFPSQTLHTGSTCTDAANRFVLNLNYFPG